MWGQPLPSSYFDPHGQSTRGVAVSMVKLVYLLFANWIGYLLAVRPGLTKGDLVLFDRYFPDCLVDPRRYRLPASCRWAAELIAGLVPKPDLYVLLDAPARVLQQRKSEVPLSESERQRSSYEAQGAKLGNLVVVDARRPLAEVMDAVVNCIIDLRLARSTERFEAA
jgi:thymidylate kinase